ncbi:UDP-glucose:glycoprotein glucosyltransferase [Eufriesea mexicana]|uniref:UDP-glucose:glycoprotein glucosyltransferase n=1 Tax=Eufriesea mexicana TaxID=516756 RepID=A0A310SD69_9HYME|nr:UDP-glucose:glycoprotein glucosyltransferase [Eufriesea mexicana]
MRLTTFLCFLLLCVICFEADKRVNKYVTTLINAKWKETPLVLEAAEYLNDENPSYFWKFIDTFASYDLRNVTEKDNYDAVIEFAEKYLSPSEVALMKLGLSLRIYSARVEMFTQMAENKNISAFDCYNVVDIGGIFTCSLEELEKLSSQDSWLNPDIYSVDHRYHVSQHPEKIIILYGQVGTPKFSDFHNKLKTLARTSGINYILRHYLKDRTNKHVRLSGYGVELQMKSTEYKATDDSDIKDNAGKNSETINDSMEEIHGINFVILKAHVSLFIFILFSITTIKFDYFRNLYPDKQLELDKLQTHLLETSQEIGALKVWQFQELSHQAAERIMNSPTNEAINVLTDISQNFPIQAKSLIKTKVNSEMKKEMKLNQAMFSASLNIQPTETALFINGLFFDLEAVDVLSLLESLRSELRVMESLRFNNKEISTLLTLDLSTNTDKQEFAMDIRDSAIIWVNDIEHDAAYARWSSSLTELLRPTFPGMIRNIRKNLYNLVLIIDPLSGESIPLITLAQSLYLHSAPLRVGFVFVTNYDTAVTGLTDASVAINNAYHYFAESKGSEHALQFLIDLGNYVGSEKMDVEDIKKAIKLQDSSANINYILGEESEYDVGRHLASDFVKRSGFKKFPQALLNGVPLSSDQLNSNSFEEAVLSTIMSQTPALQKAVYRGEITEEDDVVDYIMNQPNVMPRLNERILKPEKHTWLNLIGTIPNDEDYNKWSPQDFSTWLMSILRYIYVPRRTNIHHLYTFWVVTDLNDSAGRQLLCEALEYIESNADVRITVIVNPHVDTNDADNTIDINQIVLAVLHSFPIEKAMRLIRNIIKEDIANVSDKIDMTGFTEEDITEQSKILLSMHRRYVKTVLNLEKGVRAIVCNGRLIGPLDDGEEFTSEDFSLLERFSQSTYDDKLFKKLIKGELLENDEYEKNEVTDDMIMKITSLLASHPQTRNRFHVPFYGDDYRQVAIKIPTPNPNEVAFNLIAIVDPVSRGAQKLGPILKTLQQSLNCNVKVFLNCLDKNSDMPLKSFYRFVFEPELKFSSDGRVNGAVAKFTKLPSSSLLTQYIHAPENCEFELEYLLLEGHCFEAVIGNPPRGLQITLGTEKHPLMVDTIVMANLGYFQLKANPGEWILRLRQGRSAEIYDFTTISGQDVLQNGNDVKVLISSLRSHVLKVKVSKKPDKVGMDLLSEDDKSSGLWNSISRTFTTADDSDDQDEKLNIFSLASGHLYERFLKIMMLSVIKHTKSPVKFWFLKNYLSPTLKDFLPYMAKEYGFEFELVQYKWPRWLHQQTEKQRTIWGYKILFLDVLFPLNVKKIIFVDADQVVRADLKELATMDLGGAPYAYTPFCNSRKEMDGFRFWKQGYWRNHLQGRAYHISALYVVDLKRFRRIAAGDRLRGQYQALSQDPNSLANLDQDLPNNMIHQVAIKTLPQEWLWCETWCDDASKKYAKTIDLCNNPMTKEAKLQAAVRILPEWIGYDEEIKALQLKLENENGQTEKKANGIN